ncbi:MAG: hypothetical protein WCP34_12205 [Pseudomonadota bacterium]
MSKETLPNPTVLAHSLMSGQDIHWLREGTHTRLYDKLGGHKWASFIGDQK